MIAMHVFQPDEYALLKKSALFYLSLGIDHLNLSETLARANKKIAEMSHRDVKRTLIPVLKRGETFDIHAVSVVVNDFMNQLLVLTPDEKSYLVQFNEGIYLTQLLFSDEDITNRIKNHPMAIWKSQKRSSQ